RQISGAEKKRAPRERDALCQRPGSPAQSRRPCRNIGPLTRPSMSKSRAVQRGGRFWGFPAVPRLRVRNAVYIDVVLTFRIYTPAANPPWFPSDRSPLRILKSQPQLLRQLLDR